MTPRIWVRSSRERTSIETKSLFRSKPGGTKLKTVLQLKTNLQRRLNWGLVRKKENHENIMKENVEQIGVQEWMGKEPHSGVEGRLVLVTQSCGLDPVVLVIEAKSSVVSHKSCRWENQSNKNNQTFWEHWLWRKAYFLRTGGRVGSTEFCCHCFAAAVGTNFWNDEDWKCIFKNEKNEVTCIWLHIEEKE